MNPLLILEPHRNADTDSNDSDNDLVPKPGKSKTNKSEFKSGHYCCVVNCHKRTGREKQSFFHVNRANKTQTDMWRQAIRRENPDGSLWKPSAHSKICGLHFIKGTVIQNKYFNLEVHPF